MSKTREYTTIRYTIWEVIGGGLRKMVPGAQYDLDLWYGGDRGLDGWEAADEALETLRHVDPNATFEIEQDYEVVTR